MRKILHAAVGFFVAFAAFAADMPPLLAQGKVVLVLSGETGPVVFWRQKNGSIVYEDARGNVDAEWTAVADQVTAANGMPERNERRFRVMETYAGPAANYRPPIEDVKGGLVSLFHLASVPPGAKNILLLQAFDGYTAQQGERTHQVMAIAFEDDVPFDVLRKVALEEGVMRIFKAKDIDDFKRARRIYIGGQLPQRPYETFLATVEAVTEETITGRGNGAFGGVAVPVGSQVGMAYGTATGIGAVLGFTVLDKLFGSGQAVAHAIRYKADGQAAAEVALVGSMGKDLKEGDRIRITRGSFITKVERLSE